MNVIEKPDSKYCTLIIDTVKECYRIDILNDLQYTYKQMCKCDFIKLKFSELNTTLVFSHIEYKPFLNEQNTFEIIQFDDKELTLNIQNIVRIDLKKIDVDDNGDIKFPKISTNIIRNIFETEEQAKLAYDKFKLEKDSKK
jgi:hypothetical protein